MSSLWSHLIGVSILVLMLTFLGIWIWAWRPRHRRTFDALAQLPMEDLAVQDLNDGSPRRSPTEDTP